MHMQPGNQQKMSVAAKAGEMQIFSFDAQLAQGQFGSAAASRKQAGLQLSQGAQQMHFYKQTAKPPLVHVPVPPKEIADFLHPNPNHASAKAEKKSFQPILVGQPLLLNTSVQADPTHVNDYSQKLPGAHKIQPKSRHLAQFLEGMSEQASRVYSPIKNVQIAKQESVPIRKSIGDERRMTAGVSSRINDSLHGKSFDKDAPLRNNAQRVVDFRESNQFKIEGDGRSQQNVP